MIDNTIEIIRESLHDIINTLDIEDFDNVSANDYLILQNIGDEASKLLDMLDLIEG